MANRRTQRALRLLGHPLTAAGLIWLFARRSERAIAAAPLLEAQAHYPARRWPRVSVIVPARNEARTLPRLLPSLRALDYPDYELLVVDDQSSDGTAAIAAAAGARVVPGSGPPPGWSGKVAACATGAAAADRQSEWLLFTDADTWHAPSSLRAAMHAALAAGADLLSISPRQECETWAERALLPFVFRQFFAGVSPSRIADPSRPDALANGQYILVRRATYERLGGHAALAGSIIEDVALARRFKRAGARVVGFNTNTLVRVRMYDSLPAIWEGFSKNSASFVALDRRQGLLVGWSSSLSAAGPLGVLRALLQRDPLHLAPAVALLWTQREWNRRFGVAALEPAQLLAPLMLLAIAWNSWARRLLRRDVRWKGRGYVTTPLLEAPLPSFAPQHGSPPWPVHLALPLALDMLRNRPRPLLPDAQAMVAALPEPPSIAGSEHLPQDGSFVLVANHYQRLDLWIGWAGGLLHSAAQAARPNAPFTMHWLTIDRVWTGKHALPGTQALFQRVAAVWNMVPISPRAEDVAARGASLRRLVALARAARNGPDVVIGIFPEGQRGGGAGLLPALPGTGTLLSALAHSGLALQPAAVWQEGRRFHLRFGPAFAANGDDAAVRATAMRAIAALLPPEQRGVWRECRDEGC